MVPLREKWIKSRRLIFVLRDSVKKDRKKRRKAMIEEGDTREIRDDFIMPLDTSTLSAETLEVPIVEQSMLAQS